MPHPDSWERVSYLVGVPAFPWSLCCNRGNEITYVLQEKDGPLADRAVMLRMNGLSLRVLQ